jgi:hypothetical protein
MCWNCSTPNRDEPMPLSRHRHCDQCAEALHCCRQCTNYDPSRADQCSEQDADPPADKTMANFCDWFAIRLTSQAAQPASDSRAALDALFGKNDASETDTPSSRDKLDDLFK